MTHTQTLIQQAQNKQPAERTRCDRVLIVLSHGKPVSSFEVMQAGGLGYRQRVTELRQRGLTIENQPAKNSPKGENWHTYQLILEDAQ